MVVWRPCRGLDSRVFAPWALAFLELQSHQTLESDGQWLQIAVTCARTTRLMGDSSLLRGDLDWVVMKCLEKQRERRYETANGLARDIQRYLANEAVEARPPSTGYRMKKFIHRNRAMVAAVSAVAVALVIGIIGFAWQASIANYERTLADHERDIADRARVEADEQRELAQDRLYDSLFREARVLRTNRPIGFRRECFDRLRQAAAIPTSKRDVAVLNSEASRCLGDPVGLDPVEFPGRWNGERPGNPGSPAHAIDASGSVCARGTADCQLRGWHVLMHRASSN